ncbi:T6SS effector BTH_I2691 family protein [Massilia haematophila]|uniref:T6SS effector BTH_I2691 family protein n=1 Tax=Massilia haematophila TaxID=457923 RepID=A0ABV7PRC6_9BURK
MTTSTRCDFCDKRGLPLLLVRDAVAPAGAGAPLAPSLPIELAPTAAHYTKRLLRSGYVNVYDEARRRWEAYFVTADGYFFKLLQTSGVAPVVPAKPFNCADEGHRAVASCITISDPKNASKVWIGFSDVLWTDAVRKANDDPTYRKRHMVEIDVQSAIKGKQAPHRPMAQVTAVVAEYAMAPKDAKFAFSASPFNFDTRYGRAESLVRECNALAREKGLIVTLPDPAGITQELALLMECKIKSFISKNPVDQRNLAASAAIDRIEEAYRKSFEDTEIATTEQLADEQITENPFGHLFSASTREKTERLREVTSNQLDRASNDGWKKYASKFDNKSRQAWLKPFSQRFETFNKDYIAPLALSHATWMKAQALAAYFECNYDVHSVDSGTVYTMVVTQCVTATQDKQACSRLYEEWLGGDVADKENILLRAMIGNQKINEEAVKAAITVSADLRQIPWDNIFAAYNTAGARLAAGAQDAAARLIVQIGGPLARIFNKVLDGSAGFRAAIMATGLVSGHPVIFIEVTGSRKEFRKLAIRELLRASGQTVSNKVLGKAVAAELKRQQIRGVRLGGNTRMRFALNLDQLTLRSIPSGLSQQQIANHLVSSFRTVEALENINLNRWRSVINQEMGSGIVAAILQAITLTKLLVDKEKSLANEKGDASGRVEAGMCAIAGSTSEVLGNFLKNRALLGMRFGQGLVASMGRYTAIIGRVTGLGGSLYMAFLDAEKYTEARNENQPGLAWLYGASAISGLALASVLFYPAILGAAAIPVIGLLILLCVGIGLLIENLKDNPIQDWLERCPWGMLSSQRYPDMATEQAQLLLALK